MFGPCSRWTSRQIVLGRSRGDIWNEIRNLAFEHLKGLALGICMIMCSYRCWRGRVKHRECKLVLEAVGYNEGTKQRRRMRAEKAFVEKIQSRYLPVYSFKGILRKPHVLSGPHSCFS